MMPLMLDFQQILTHLKSFWDSLPPYATMLLIVTAINLAYRHFEFRRTQRRSCAQATLQLLDTTELSPEHRDLMHSFSQVTSKYGGFDRLIDLDTAGLSTSVRRDVISLLNHYEIVALGILKGAIDEDYCRQYLRYIFLARWQEAEPYIRELRRREKNRRRAKTIYNHFEKLVRRWK